MIKVSVIIPFYNRNNKVNWCLDNVFKQTLNEIEVVCVDDGSTDNTLASLHEYRKKEKRIKVVNKENGGAGSARNLGIRHAVGDYLFFLDCDDELYDEKVLETLYNKAEQNGADICGGILLTSDDNVLTEVKETKFNQDGFIDFYSDQNCFNFTRFIYKTDFIKDNEILFPDLFYFEDPVFLVKAMVAAKKFFYLDKRIYIYNQEHQKELKRSISQLCDYLAGIRTILNISNENGLDKLHDSTFGMLYYSICNEIEQVLPTDNMELFKEILLVNSSIKENRNSCISNESNEVVVLPILEHIWNTSNKYTKLRKMPIFCKIISCLNRIKKIKQK